MREGISIGRQRSLHIFLFDTSKSLRQVETSNDMSESKHCSYQTTRQLICNCMCLWMSWPCACGCGDWSSTTTLSPYLPLLSLLSSESDSITHSRQSCMALFCVNILLSFRFKSALFIPARQLNKKMRNRNLDIYRLVGSFISSILYAQTS